MTEPKHKSNYAIKNEFLSLLALLAAPLSLMIFIIFSFGSSRKYHGLPKPFWFPRLSLVHLASMASTVLMSLAAWLVWASGGLHHESDASPLYLAQIAASIVWCPLVLRLGAIKIAFGYYLINFGILFGCYLNFGKINPSSKIFVKPCLAWAAYMTFVTCHLMYV